MTELVTVTEVTKRFGGMTALDSVSLSVNEGEILGLLGPNGAGKTTLLNCISGAERVSGGRIGLLGRDVTRWRPESRCQLGLARTFQIPRPFPRLTAYENVLVAAYFGSRRGRRTARDRALQLLEQVELGRAITTLASQLSTAELRRLDLARALASEPRIVLLDEMAAGVTTGELAQLMGLLRAFNRTGTTFVVVEHVMSVVSALCQRVVVLDYGKKLNEGPTQAVLSHPGVVAAYLGGEVR